MAWVPKRINQNKNDVHASIATSTIKEKKEKDGSNKQLSRRCASQHQNLRLAHHPFSSTMPLMPLPWNSSLAIHTLVVEFYMDLMVMADICLSSLEYVNTWPVQYSNIVLSLIGERDKIRAHGNLYVYLNGVET